MRKMILKEMQPFIDSTFEECKYSSICRLSNGSIFKLFGKTTLANELKIIKSDELYTTDVIIKPSICVYDGDTLVGYIMDYVDGSNCDEIKNNFLNKLDLFSCADLYLKIEKVIKKIKMLFFQICVRVVIL